MFKTPFAPTRQQIIDVLNNSMSYEILFTFGVPVHDPTDYCNWETVNFTRMAHARLLYDFMEMPVVTRHKDDVLAEDFGYPAAPIPLPSVDRHRLNKDLMHFTYDRLRHTPAAGPWPDSILACLHGPVLDFMCHVEKQTDLFRGPDDLQAWRDLINCMQSGKEMVFRCSVDSGKRPTYQVSLGAGLPTGKAAFTKFGQPYWQ
jgi:hypothetical protein